MRSICFHIIAFLCLLFTGTEAIAQCDTLAFNQRFDSIEKYIRRDINKALDLSLGVFEDSKACINTRVYYEAVHALATVYDQKDMPDSIIKLIKPILDNTKIKIPLYNKARLEHKMSNAYITLLQLENALKYCLLALKDFETNGNEVNATNMLINISNVYQQQNNFKQANQFLREAEKKAHKLGKPRVLGNLYNTMGILYAEHKLLDSAERFFLISTKIREEIGDKTSVVWNYNNLGGLYVLMNKPDKAIVYLEKALERFKEDENYDGQTSVANNLGELYSKKGDRKKALYYFSYSRQLYSLTNNPDNLENLYKNLSIYYDELGDLKTAFLYSDSLIVLKDSLYGKRLDESIAEMQTKFDVEKKNLQIANQKDELLIKEKQNRIKNIIIVSILVGIVLLSLLGILYYQRHRLKQKELLNAEMLRQQELRSKAVVEAEENERTRIARELHDGIGQQLSAARLNLDGLKTLVKPELQDQQQLFKNALDLVDESIKEVRNVSHSMMPNTLLKAGLVSAVREFINKISDIGSLKINLEIVGLNERLDQVKEGVMFRVLQEIISNIVKHAKASEVTIQLIRHENELSLLVEDNGIGFNVKDKLNDEGGGIGLKNIQSRVQFLNGQIFYDSYEGKGTTVSIEVPLG
ncbi:MAG: tetratricopeptide repeat-containing sensor histidine kinase [Bacteroidia bacterium]